MIYLLWSPRSQGWFTNSSTYSSALSDAKTFDRETALKMCRKQKESAGYNLLPIRMEDLNAI